LPLERRNEHTAVQECPGRPPCHYRKPRRSAISRSNSRRLSSFPPPAM
jgi:hypothetical protein